MINVRAETQGEQRRKIRIRLEVQECLSEEVAPKLHLEEAAPLEKFWTDSLMTALASPTPKKDRLELRE